MNRSWWIAVSLLALFISQLPAAEPVQPVPTGAPEPTQPPAAAATPTPAPPKATKERPLLGIKVCVDAGHGGDQSGAVGAGGLIEKDINLKVATKLADMLRAAGAEVLMIRTEDIDVPLVKRAHTSRDWGADLFVSVHHNANSQGDTVMNRNEAFWHWKDDGGPSEDAARILSRHFRETMKTPGKPYMCWAYGVLRENAYPAILGEASYLQNPEEEKRLRDDAYLATQAGAYFRAIEEFFAGGKPEIQLYAKCDPSERRVVQAFLMENDEMSLLDPTRTRVELDGQPLVHDTFYRRNDFAVVFARLPESGLSGEHTITLAGRNVAGRHTKVVRAEFAFTDPWKKPAAPPQAHTGEFTIFGRVPGTGGAVGPLAGAELFGQQIRDVYALANEDGVVRLDAAERITEEPHIVRAPGYWTAEADLRTTSSATLEPMFAGALIGKKIIVDPEWGGDAPGPVAPNGLRACDVNLETATFLADYLRRAGATVWMTRAADVSMDNVSRVRFALERDPDLFITIGHRAAEPGMKEKPGQDVSRGGGRWDESTKFVKAALPHLRQLLGTGKELGDPTSRAPLPSEVHSWSSWEVMHAGQKYAATYICPRMFDATGAAERLGATANARKEALALLYGTLNYFGLDDRPMSGIDGVVVDAATGKPIGDALVWIDDTLIVQTEADGKFIAKFLAPGKHTLRALALDHAPTTAAVHVEKAKTARAALTMLSAEGK